MRLGLAVAVVLACLTACQSAPPPRTTAPDARPAAVPGADGPVRTARPVAVVVREGRAEACLGGSSDTLPPSCAAPVPVLGWDWAGQDGLEDHGGTRFGLFELTGEFDGAALTVSTVAPGSLSSASAAEPAVDVPCGAPPGGWAEPDPDRASEVDLRRTARAAEAFDDLGDVRLAPVSRTRADDPRTLLVVTVTGDVATAEEALRQTWGGMLCVARAAHTREELLAIQQATLDLPGFLSSGPAPDRLDLQVQYDDGSYQRWADAEYGPGVVVVTSALVPV